VVYYTSNAERALRRVEAFRAEETSHRIEPAVERDTHWGMYRSFRQAGKK
jgi:hypothetical protein